MRAVSVLLLVLAVAGTAEGQMRYVDDELVITVRTGPSTRNQIIRNLRSGQRVEVLETNEEGYSRVRVVADGTEGWVLTQYLTDERIAADRLAQARTELEAARERAAQLEERVTELSAQLESVRADLTEAETESERRAAELADVRSASANAIALRDENETMQGRVNELSQQVETARMVNAELQSRSRQSWFIVGAGVLLAGIVIGLVAPSLRRRRRTNW